MEGRARNLLSVRTHGRVKHRFSHHTQGILMLNDKLSFSCGQVVIDNLSLGQAHGLSHHVPHYAIDDPLAYGIYDTVLTGVQLHILVDPIPCEYL
jgi:hypothetical protein